RPGGPSPRPGVPCRRRGGRSRRRRRIRRRPCRPRRRRRRRTDQGCFGSRVTFTARDPSTRRTKPKATAAASRAPVNARVPTFRMVPDAAVGITGTTVVDVEPDVESIFGSVVGGVRVGGFVVGGDVGGGVVVVVVGPVGGYAVVVVVAGPLAGAAVVVVV